MGGNESNNLVKGALILTLAGFVSKILSAGYRIPLQNLTGDIGFYIYQQIYPFLGMAIVLALYGFPSAISKMTNDFHAQGKPISLKSLYIPLFFILVIINGAIFSFIYFNATGIGTLMGDPNLTKSLQTTAFVFLLIPFTALMRGVFQGSYQMRPTAISQVGEQLIRVFIIIAAAIVFSSEQMNIYTIGVAGAIAAIAGAIAATIILGVFFLKQAPWPRSQYTIPWGYYLKMLLFFGLIAALNHMILLVIQLADAFTLVPGLQDFGLTEVAAMEAKGIFDRGQPLIQLCTVLGSSFALALIPNLSREKLKKRPEETYHFARSALSFCFILTVGATVGIILIFPEANRLLFLNQNGTDSLRILMLAIVFSSLAITAISILQGLNRMKRTALFILFSLVVKWLGNQLLVPLFGITGSAIATVLALLFLCYVVFLALKRELPELYFFKQLRWRALVLASGGMGIYVRGIDLLVPDSLYVDRSMLFIYVIVVALSGAIIYLLLLLKFHAFTEKQLRMLPYASFLIRFQRGRNNYG
ncbi:putative polysaccharide biosynthesis protein [Virgibacillus necropolis]|uniref:Low temperature requirement protein B n=1 Tax=Virgibacillus necropolis TaxID=163877 RepID=A0A221M7W8_9BACI|nr:polysaccharide biosynthesis protein [Virgibacillus necropolis]ASN03735.1 low temperature requirement protein B [Virgibacillus necropolis]